jgi:hypothetical protein
MAQPYRRVRRPDELTHELGALRTVIEVLQGLPSDARSRVIGYVIRRYPNPERAVPWSSPLAAQYANVNAQYGVKRG